MLVQCHAPGGCKGNAAIVHGVPHPPLRLFPAVKTMVEVPDGHVGPVYCSVECAVYHQGVKDGKFAAGVFVPGSVFEEDE